MDIRSHKRKKNRISNFHYDPFKVSFLQNVFFIVSTLVFVLSNIKNMFVLPLVLLIQTCIFHIFFFRTNVSLAPPGQDIKKLILKSISDINKEPSPKKALAPSILHEISGLQAQISPHFLCNTLESIRGHAMIIGDETIEKMTEALSSLFRYSISRKENIVSLKDELYNISQYMKIQKFRFGERFNLTVEMNTLNDIREIFMPKLLLQPLVENSIQHGLMSKEEGGIVKIYIMQNLQMVTIDIIDYGVGMSEETLNSIIGRKPLATTSRYSGTGMGIGIDNIIDRIHLYYGPEYGLKIYSAPNAGTQVTVTFPFDENLFKTKI